MSEKPENMRVRAKPLAVIKHVRRLGMASHNVLAPPQQHIFDTFSNGEAADEWSLNVLALSDDERRRAYGAREKAVLSVARALQPAEEAVDDTHR